MKYLICFFVLYWIYLVINQYRKIYSINSLINKYESFFDQLPGSNDTSFIRSMIKTKPMLEEHLSWLSTLNISYHQKNDKELIRAYFEAYTSLLEVKDKYDYNLKKTQNPLNALKEFIKIPSTLIKYLDINIKPGLDKIVNLIIWIIVFLLNMYSDEIKVLIKNIYN